MRLTNEERGAIAKLSDIIGAPGNRGNKDVQDAWDVVAPILLRVCADDTRCKPLTDEDQAQLDVIRSLRMRNPCGTTLFEVEWLLELIDRLPREPRKKTLGQVLYESLGKSRPWETILDCDKRIYEERARAVVEEYEKRKASGGS